MRTLSLLLTVPGLLAAQSIRPMWVSQVPSQEGRVYAMGVASLQGNQATALTQAQANARGEVIARLRAQVQSTTDVRATSQVHRSTDGPTTGASNRTVTQATTVEAKALDLPGLVVEETWVDRPGAAVYALAYLDVPVAERELRARFQTQREALEAGPRADTGSARERLRRLQTLRSAQVELERLDDLAGLLAAGGGEAQLRAEVRRARLALEARLERLRATLTFSLAGVQETGLGADVATLVRNAVLKQGLGWADQGGEFVLSLRTHTARATANAGNAGAASRSRFWHAQPDDTLVVARGALDITLTDRAGTAYESTTLEAKGVGVSDFQAERRLLDNTRQQLGDLLGQWLMNLTR